MCLDAPPSARPRRPRTVVGRATADGPAQADAPYFQNRFIINVLLAACKLFSRQSILSSFILLRCCLAMDEGPPRLGFYALCAATLAAVAVFLAWLRGAWFGPTATLWFSDLTQFAAPTLAAWLCWRRGRTLPGHMGTTWTLLAVAVSFWAIAQGIWSYYELVLGRLNPVATLAEVWFLLFPLAAGAALIHLSCHGMSWRNRVRILLDGAITASLLLLAGWAFFLEDAWAQTSTDLAERVLLLWYPVADIFIVTLVMISWIRIPRKGWLTMGLLTSGLVTLSIADTAFLYLNYTGAYATGQPVDAGWFLGFLLVGLAAASPRRIRDFVELRPSNLFLDTLPVVSVLATVGIASYVLWLRGSFSAVYFWMAAVYATLLVARQTMTVVENRALWLQAEKNLAALGEQQRIRSQMLNTLTHDLLSPLSAVRVQLKLFAVQDQGLSERHQKALHVVKRNVEHVVRLGNDFKDVANLDSGRLPVVPEPVDVAQLTRDAVDSFSATASEKDVELRLDGSRNAPATADPGRITQVLYNFLSNALKFTPPGGAVTVTVTHGSLTRLEVSDTGRGLDSHETLRLFRPFSQVHDRNEVDERGTGLGLFISKGIVESHGGRIGVRSDGRGTGSTFWFTLPDVCWIGRTGRATPAPAPQAATADRDGAA